MRSGCRLQLVHVQPLCWRAMLSSVEQYELYSVLPLVQNWNSTFVYIALAVIDVSNLSLVPISLFLNTCFALHCLVWSNVILAGTGAQGLGKWIMLVYASFLFGKF